MAAGPAGIGEASMAKSRCKTRFEHTASDAGEPGSPSARSEGSAIGAFILLLVASGIAAVSFFLASPDRSLGGDTAMRQVGGMPE